jgi:hypothetical protein
MTPFAIALHTFAAARQRWLNPPASKENLDWLGARFGAASERTREMYELFDGEKDFGALFRGFSVRSLDDFRSCVLALDDVWDSLDDDEIAPVRDFLPIIRTCIKTDIGPIATSDARLNGLVIEYCVFTGRFRVWCESWSAFVESFFALSVQLHIKSDKRSAWTESSYDHHRHVFNASDRGFLSNWQEVKYPVSRQRWKDIDFFRVAIERERRSG